MSKLKVTGRMRSANENYEETFFRYYTPEGDIKEEKVLSNEGDYPCGAYVRYSKDNGRTWGEWEKQFDDSDKGRRGKLENSPEGDELLGGVAPTLYDPVSGCTVGVGGTFYYLKGHDVGYFEMWENGADNFRMHAYYVIRYPDGREVKRMFELEEGGADFDPENPRNPAFIDKNRIGAGDLRILPDGDLSFILYPTMRLCCKIAGVDVNTYFPSCPDLQTGIIIARAHWNGEKNDYDITYSAPIMLSDLQSARGIMEPQLMILKSGRWLLTLRGAAMNMKAWNTRTTPGTPPFRWYTFSDDGGRTWAPVMPWHFDTREVVYSPASISGSFRSSKNGKLYWIGNILTEPWLVDSSGSDPRWPLQICEVNEEYGYLIKDTLTEIDTKREGESYFTELSNFNLLEDRETLDLELRLTKICQRRERYEDEEWYSEAWEYLIQFE